jgi:hypothetical protein
VQVIKAIDDGGFSMLFQRDHDPNQRSQRLVLSLLEVLPSIPFLTKRQTAEMHAEESMKILQTATLLKYTPKCLVKFVKPNSMTQ